MTADQLILTGIGLLAQGFFSARILVQWYKSEKSRSLQSPTLYWVFSLIGSYLMFIYGWGRNDFSIIVGQFITYYIYIWNLNAKGHWQKIPALLKVIIAATPIVALCFVLKDAGVFFDNFLGNEDIPLWLVIFGTAGQTIFSLRFVYQIIYSARRHESSLPLQFWAISLLGSGIIICYGIIRLDIVLILGQSFGFLSYIRSVMIGLKARKTSKQP